MFVALDVRFQLNCDEPLIVHVSAPFPNVLLLVPLFLFFAAGAHQARLLRRLHEHSTDDIEGEKATPIDHDFKPLLLRYHDGLEDFRAALMLEQLHWVSDDGTIGYWLFWHLMTPWGIWVQPWIHR